MALVAVLGLLPMLTACGSVDEELFKAAFKGDQKQVQAILGKGATVNAARTDTGVTPLHMAAQQGHREVVALLLAQGANVNAASARTDGATPLHSAAYSGHREVVEILLKNGANKAAKMKAGQRPVDLARQQGHRALVPLLEP